MVTTTSTTTEPQYTSQLMSLCIMYQSIRGHEWSVFIILGLIWGHVSLYPGCLLSICSVSCSALQRRLTFYPTLKKLSSEIYIVLLTFNPILLRLAFLPLGGPLKVTDHCPAPNSISRPQRLLTETLWVKILVHTENVCMNHADLWFSSWCLSVTVCVWNQVFLMWRWTHSKSVLQITVGVITAASHILNQSVTLHRQL